MPAPGSPASSRVDPRTVLGEPQRHRRPHDSSPHDDDVHTHVPASSRGAPRRVQEVRWAPQERRDGIDGPMTLSAKILAAHGVEDLTPGAFALARVDRVMVNDVSGAVSIREFERMGASGCSTPTGSRASSTTSGPPRTRAARRSSRGCGRSPSARASRTTGRSAPPRTRASSTTILAERGRVMPGDLLVGADSHTCTNGAFGAFGTGMGSSDIAAALALGEVWLQGPRGLRGPVHRPLGPHVTGKDLILAYIAQAGVDGATYASLEFGGEAVAGWASTSAWRCATWPSRRARRPGSSPPTTRRSRGCASGCPSRVPEPARPPTRARDYDAAHGASTSTGCGRSWPHRRRPATSTRSTS